MTIFTADETAYLWTADGFVYVRRGGVTTKYRISDDVVWKRVAAGAS